MHPLNYINELFYSSVKEAFSSYGLADFFVKTQQIQNALALKIIEIVPDGIIKELGSGTLTDRWRAIGKVGRGRSWQITLSDFSENSLADISSISVMTGEFTFKTEKYNLFDKFEKLGSQEKLNVLLATYVFDSLWFPQDVHYEKRENKWFKAYYQLEVGDEASGMLAGGSFYDGELLNFFGNLNVKKTLNLIDITKETFGRLIADYYLAYKFVRTNFPGGLIEKVGEAFSRQLKSDGVFIIGDIAYSNYQNVLASGDIVDMEDFSQSGKIAKFKIDDYGLAKAVLENSGYTVDLINLSDFLVHYGFSLPLDLYDHWLMFVKKPVSFSIG